MNRPALILGLIGMSLPVLAADEPHPFISGGYQEAVFNVSDIDAQIEFYQSVAGWELIYRGDVERELIDAYGLPGTVNATEVVLANPGPERGFVRLIDYDGIEQVQMRSSAQSWDTGGWFDVNTRVADMDAKFREFQVHDWQAVSDPVEFSFGPFVVEEWLARGPDGIVIAMIERKQPPLEGWPHLKELSRLFNATQIVSDIDSARGFYIDKLGFDVYLEHSGPSPAAGPNVLGLPHNLAADITRHVYILHPTGVNEGSIELLAFEGLTGTDFAERSEPGNLGIFTLRFPVTDMDSFYTYIRNQQIEIALSPINTSLLPYGDGRLMAIRGPGNVWIEFYELADD
jgi:catechol 2,3-dioxygenase-like lactoylglutathione lyase family enzyme